MLLLENITVKEVPEEHYLKALSIAEDQQVGANDALAYVLMKKAGINRIYSFDRDFNKFKDVHIITE